MNKDVSKVAVFDHISKEQILRKAKCFSSCWESFGVHFQTSNQSWEYSSWHLQITKKISYTKNSKKIMPSMIWNIILLYLIFVLLIQTVRGYFKRMDNGCWIRQNKTNYFIPNKTIFHPHTINSICTADDNIKWMNLLITT